MRGGMCACLILGFARVDEGFVEGRGLRGLEVGEFDGGYGVRLSVVGKQVVGCVKRDCARHFQGSTFVHLSVNCLNGDAHIHTLCVSLSLSKLEKEPCSWRLHQTDATCILSTYAQMFLAPSKAVPVLVLKNVSK